MSKFEGVSVMAKYRKYSKEFKLQAAKLVTEQGYSCEKAGKRLGTTGWSVRNWIKKFQQTGELPTEAETQPQTNP
jgi:transposase-like protein